jgi:putative colanic acid biosynthesis glycosyltransferase WcaI
MHILFVTHYFEPSSGAAATRLSALARRLLARGHQITVLTTMPHYPKGKIDANYRGRFVKIEERDGLRVIYVWLWATPSSKISRRLMSQLSFMLTATLRGMGLQKPDIVFIEAQPIFTGVASRIIADMKRVPYVLNISDLWPDHLLSVGALSEDSSVYKMARSVVDAGYRGASAIVTMSPKWTEKVIGYLGGESDKVTTILRGVDTKRFQPLSHEEIAPFMQKYSLETSKKWVSFLGTFATQYDFEMTLDIVKHFSARDDVGFVFIGAGTQGEKVQQRINDGDLTNVRLIDWVTHDEMPFAWNASTINFWAMRDEALYYGTVPAKLYEALSCGTPIAAAQGGDAAEIIQKSGGGLVVNPNNKVGLRATIERLLDDETLRESCRQNGRDYALANFDFDRVAEQYEAVIQRALRQR